jgi:hypothetical protein
MARACLKWSQRGAKKRNDMMIILLFFVPLVPFCGHSLLWLRLRRAGAFAVILAVFWKPVGLQDTGVQSVINRRMLFIKLLRSYDI